MPSRWRRYSALAALAGLAALTTLHVWFNILHVAWVRPLGALFDASQAVREGWAAWYVPSTFAAVLTFALLHLYFRRPQRWTLLALAVAGLCAAVFGTWAAYWVKNIGYTWYFVPGATVAAILGVQPQMAAMAFARAAHLLAEQLLLLAIGAVAGLLVGLVLRVPFRVVASTTATREVAPATMATIEPPQRAGLPARLTTAALMAALAGGVASLRIPLIGIAIAPFAGLIWYFVSFRDGFYRFWNVVLGSTAIAFLIGLPLALLTTRLSFPAGFEGMSAGTGSGGLI